MLQVAPASRGFNSASRRIAAASARWKLPDIERQIVSLAVSGVTPETTRGTRVLPVKSVQSQPGLQPLAQNLAGAIQPRFHGLRRRLQNRRDFGHVFVKLLADPRTGEVLGGCCVGPVGGELVHEIIAAMHKRMTVHELAVMPHYHPTLAEIWTYPAEELAAKCG